MWKIHSFKYHRWYGFPTSGQVLLNGEDITNYKDREITKYRKEKIGFIFQFYNLLPDLTALENVKMSLSKKDEEHISEKTLELVGLGNQKMHQYPNANFSITMIDLNYLKVTNDTYGHEKGDDLIVSLAELIKQIFVKSSIYRIGGDEFAIVSEDEDLKNIKQLEQQFKSKSQEVNAAIGVATFDKAKDNNVEDTFKRADRRMYENKKKMKQEK